MELGLVYFIIGLGVAMHKRSGEAGLASVVMLGALFGLVTTPPHTDHYLNAVLWSLCLSVLCGGIGAKLGAALAWRLPLWNRHSLSMGAMAFAASLNLSPRLDQWLKQELNLRRHVALIAGAPLALAVVFHSNGSASRLPLPNLLVGTDNVASHVLPARLPATWACDSAACSFRSVTAQLHRQLPLRSGLSRLVLERSLPTVTLPRVALRADAGSSAVQPLSTATVWRVIDDFAVPVRVRVLQDLGARMVVQQINQGLPINVDAQDWQALSAAQRAKVRKVQVQSGAFLLTGENARFIVAPSSQLRSGMAVRDLGAPLPAAPARVLDARLPSLVRG